jgi:hypothetical protein
MMRHRLASMVLAASLAPGLASAAEKTAGTKTPPAKAAPPKALPKALAPAATLVKLPPFFGLFGSEEMIAKYGFRSRPGTYIDYDIDPKAKTVGNGHGFRMAEVGPPVPGARWIEMTSLSPGLVGQGMRILTRGEKAGNIERLIARAGGMPPMEFPLDSASLDAIAGSSKDLSSLTLPGKVVGKETVTTPLGKFTTDHWVIPIEKGRALEFWITQDEKIPFTGIVKMINDEGTVIAAKMGTDGTASIPVPQLQ